jgi:hypothetical protein
MIENPEEFRSHVYLEGEVERWLFIGLCRAWHRLRQHLTKAQLAPIAISNEEA